MSKDKLLPKLRFPEFEEAGNWETKSLREVADVYQPKTISQTDLSEDGYPVYGANGIIGFYHEYNHETNQIAIACRGSSCGTVNFTKAKSWITGNAMVVNVDQFKKINKEFMFFQLDHANLDYLVSGSGQPQITGSIKKHDVVLPPVKEEQQKIASCLSSLDELITAHSDKLDALRDHKKGLLQNLFPSAGKNVPKVRFPEFEDDGEWVIESIGSIAKVSAGGTPTSTEQKYWGGNIPWMSSGELNLKRVYSVEKTITELGLKESSTKKIPPLCVLIGLAGQGKTRGTAAINYIELCTNQSIAAIHPSRKKFDSEFLYHKIDSMYKTLRRLSTGQGGRGGLNLSIIRGIEISFPSLEEQQKIASCLSAVDELITAQQEKIEQLQQHKKGLMQGLFPNPSANSGETIES